MIACDKCKSAAAKKTNTIFQKNEKKKEIRIMLNIRMDLCEKCLDKWMQTFGKMKSRFLKSDESDNES